MARGHQNPFSAIFSHFHPIFGPLKASIAQIYHSRSVSVKLGLLVGTRCPENDQEVEVAPPVRTSPIHFRLRYSIFSSRRTIFGL